MLFGKNSRLAPEERRERVQAIERLVNVDRDDEAFRLTQALEKGTGPRHAAQHHLRRFQRPLAAAPPQRRRQRRLLQRRRAGGAHPPELRQRHHRQHRRGDLPLVLKQRGPGLLKKAGPSFFDQKTDKKGKFCPHPHLFGESSYKAACCGLKEVRG